MTEVIYRESTPEQRRAETERVIAHVRAEVPPERQVQTLHERQVQTLHDLARTADGPPQLNPALLDHEVARLDPRSPEAAALAVCPCAACCEARSAARRGGSDG